MTVNAAALCSKHLLRVEAAARPGKHPWAMTIMLRGLFALLILTGVTAHPVWPQGADFSALRDSLERLTDSALLRQIEASRRPSGKATPDRHIEHGLIALRLYALTDDATASRRAVRSFETAVENDPGRGWAHFGLGLSLAASPEAKPVYEGGSRGRVVIDDVARRLFGRDARARARREFSVALSSVPPINRAARELAGLALETQNLDWLRDARSALEALVTREQALPDDRIALASVLNAQGELEAAIVQADHALSENGPRGAALFAIATARLRSPGLEEAGMRVYFDAVRAASPDEFEQLYDDVFPIASPAEKSKWQTGDTEARRALLLSFWDVRAGLSGRTTAERLAEHYRRLPFVDQHYRRLAEFGAPERNELRWQPIQKQSRFDDRGEVYLRHGQPDEKLRTISQSFGDNNESWFYRLPDGSTRLFDFIQARGGYSLPYIIPCDREFLGDRARLDPAIARLYLNCSPANAALNSATVREMYYEALASDTHFPRFTRELPFFYDLYTFRGAPGKTAVVAAFAVPATELEKSVDEKGVHYRFDVSLILADTVLGTVSRTDDSATVRLTKALRDDDLLRTHLEVQVPPSASTLQRVIMTDATTPGIGALYWGPFPIPDYGGKDLMLSDIALGQANRGSGWKRGDVTLTLVPTSQFPSGTFDLFYEIYNLPAGRTYTTEVMIERVDKGAGGRLRDLFGAGDDVSFKFSGESTARADGTLPELRRIEAPLRKGRYRLTVNVKDHETGQTSKRSRLFRIP